MKLKNILLSGVLALGCTAASAQNEPKTEYVFNPHWYLQAQVGGQYTLGEIKFRNLLSPNIQVGVGYNFNKVVGVRLSANFWQSKGGINTYTTSVASIDGLPIQRWGTYKYKWSYVAPMVDATFNLTNLFCEYNPKRVVTVGVFGGIGANIAFNNDEASDVYSQVAALHSGSENFTYLWSGTKVRFAARAGANVDFRLSDNWSLGLEVQANTLSDRYNSKRAGNPDWYFNALVGVKYTFGKTYTTRTVTPQAPVERVIERVIEKQVPVPAPQPAQETKKAVEKMRRDIFFTINSNKIKDDGYTKIQEIVDFMKKNTETEVSVTGYADRKTGTKAINDRIAAKRADIVTEELVNRGIARDRIKKSSKGSTVQPFSDNDSNRVTICIAE